MLKGRISMLALLVGVFTVGSTGSSCPSYWDVARPNTMVRFDLVKYSAKRWYEHYVTPIPGVTDQCTCTTFDLTPKGDGNYTDGFRCALPGDNELVSNPTLIPNTVGCEAGKMDEELPPGILPPGQLAQYWVLDQVNDYKYALAYACVEFTPGYPSHFPFFLSTSSDPFPTYLYWYWRLFLEKRGVDLSGLVKTPQGSSCNYS